MSTRIAALEKFINCSTEVGIGASSLGGDLATAGVAVDNNFAASLEDLASAPTHGDLTSDKASSTPPRKKQRICVFPGCTKSVKAQGHCQAHGAIIKRCKAPGCDSQAQGSHKGYCKRHWREVFAPEKKRKNDSTKKKTKKEEAKTTCEPIGSCVFDHIIPASFAWKADGSSGRKSLNKESLDGGVGDGKRGMPKRRGAENQTELIPILQHFVENEYQEAGWHRLDEHLARGISPPKSLSVQFEPWENQLALMEMALIAGTDTKHLTHQQVTKIISHAWGREKGNLKLMISKHCSRRGDVNRKKRFDAGTGKSAKKRTLDSTLQEAPVHQLLGDSSGALNMSAATSADKSAKEAEV
ncbi:hypothetical protein ACHAXH_008057 [Discostella pseudostelligera]